MIIYKAPFRISLFGGATDYPSFLNKHKKGLVVGFGINQYAYSYIRKLPRFFDYKSKIVYSEIEHVKNNIDIKHRAINKCVQFCCMDEIPLEIHFMSDAPSFSGLGSSSALIISLCNALHYLKYNRPLSQPELFGYGSFIEQNMLRDNVGYQDICWSIYGGCCCFHFEDKKDKILLDHEYFPIKISEDLEKYGLLFFTGISRISSDIVANYISDLGENEYQLKIRSIAENAIEELQGKGDIEKIGRLLNKTWDMKKQVSLAISNKKIDEIISTLHNNGSWGSKLLGGGGGGSVFCLAPPERHYNITKTLESLGCIKIPYQIDCGGCVRIL